MEVSYEPLCCFNIGSLSGGLSLTNTVDGDEQSPTVVASSYSFFGLYFGARGCSLFCLWRTKYAKPSTYFLHPYFSRSTLFRPLVDEKYYGGGFREKLVVSYCRGSNLSFLGYRPCFVDPVVLHLLPPQLDKFELTPLFLSPLWLVRE